MHSDLYLIEWKPELIVNIWMIAAAPLHMHNWFLIMMSYFV